jgi:hypothetical protein
MEESKSIYNTIKYCLGISNFKCLLINGGGKLHIKDSRIKVLTSVGPLDFLQLISGAAFVVTNSFHGLAFSIIFGKKIYCCEHTTRNARIEDLLSTSGLDNKTIKESSNTIESIDGKTAYRELISRIEESKKYIKKCLEEYKKQYD